MFPSFWKQKPWRCETEDFITETATILSLHNSRRIPSQRLQQPGTVRAMPLAERASRRRRIPSGQKSRELPRTPCQGEQSARAHLDFKSLFQAHAWQVWATPKQLKYYWLETETQEVYQGVSVRICNKNNAWSFILRAFRIAFQEEAMLILILAGASVFRWFQKKYLIFTK